MIYWGPVAAVGTAVGMLGYAWMTIPYIGGWMVLGIGCVGSVLFRRSLFLYVTVTILAMAIGMLRMGQVGDAYGKEWENRFGKPLQVMGTILEKRASYIDERGSMVTYIMQAEKVNRARSAVCFRKRRQYICDFARISSYRYRQYRSSCRGIASFDVYDESRYV